jgi:asparagine synthase (glutamine-hydrolysing)
MPNAQGIAQHVGIEEHFCCRPDPAEYLATLSLIPGIFGQPIADTSVLANYTVTRRVAQDFTWVVGGDGPDGLYGNWDLRPWFWYYRLTPAWLRHPCADLAMLADRLLRLHLSTPSRHVQELLSQPEFSWVYHKKLKSGELERVLGRPVAADQFPVARFLKDRLDIPLYERLRIALSRFFVVDGVLQKTCGVHEAFGVDQVCPYYDRRLADFIQFLPSRYKIRGIGFGKYLHQQLLRRYLPDRLWLHRKMGFTMNLNELGLDAVRGLSDRYLSPSRVSETGLLNTGAVDDCVRGYFAGDVRMGPLVYTFLVFEMWREQFA